MNLADEVRQHAARRPDQPALVEPAGASSSRVATTWRELDERVDAAASLLGGWGLRAPQRVVLHGDSSAALVVAHLACLRTGLVSTPANPQATLLELGALTTTTGASLLLTDQDPATLVDALPDDLPVRPLRDVLGVPPADAAPIAGPGDPEALAVLVQTSGSVSQPQTVMLSHRSLATGSRQVAEVAGLGPSNVVLALLPFFHVWGLNGTLGAALHAGSTTVLANDLGPELLALMAEEGVTEMPVTPTVLFRLMQMPGVRTGLPQGLRLVSAGAPLSTALAREFTRVTGARVEQAYGLTEAGPGVCSTIGSPELISGSHVGTPLPGVEVRIGSGYGDQSEPGEVHVRGDNLFSGYWPDGRGGPDADGWFATGDLGYLSEGHLHLVGRLREVVIVSGFNVYPSEVEEVLLLHPAVQAAAVVGHPEEQTGESLVAFVSLAPGRRGLSLGDLERHCEQHLARYKCPSEIYVLERMPRSITGKIRKSELRELVDALEDEQ
ncbi:class I adenylate-forming enzyme family protein [Auraticoccus monumenti]|uniref:Long-chain acyl-CoA synthetase n=1 Tax=Auraticoccus monumenti TaxID=675864 RepID=A0A1G6RMX0_9ACTN|nr:class I adenylate-forming enzyme family protein [Auraticoccus monumenti]SDD05753.1 long-chain acyl-CoA synthetase [Auraticoccus monumenti]